jgi:hypothetical protein
LHRAPVLAAAERVILPLAVVSSASAAGVHAALAPEHLRVSLAFGVFFAAGAVAQLAWAGAAAVHGSRALLVAGVIGNTSVLALWATTRTVGLPFGLLAVPEAVGPWDVVCGAWEVVVVCCGIALLRSASAPPTRLVGWRSWHPLLPTYVAASVLLLLALSLSGSGA